MEMEKTQYSVLMSVYYKEKAEYLRAAMDSIWDQSVKTDEFILVCDGPLNAELDAVVEDMEASHRELHVLRLEKNLGLGNALNEGMKHCRNDLVARMDSDDISRPDRCEKQLRVFGENPELSICSGIVEEFTVSTGAVEARRVPPETQEEILAFARTRNPFNHPCVMYRKSAVEAAGGYRSIFLLEDYCLWVRMLQNGAKAYNLQEPLLWMRIGSDLYKRRAGWKYAQSQKALFREMKDSGFISSAQYVKSVSVRTVGALVPNGLRRMLFKTLLRD